MVAHSFNRRRAEIPIYSFAKHAREKETTSIYSPHVLILEGIFALYDPRVLQLLDMKVWIVSTNLVLMTWNWSEWQIFCEADADTCLSRRSRLLYALLLQTLTYSLVLRDVEERGRDIEGCIKQWFAFVKPNFERYVEPQRKVAGRSIYILVWSFYSKNNPCPTLYTTVLTASGEYRYYCAKGSGK